MRLTRYLLPSAACVATALSASADKHLCGDRPAPDTHFAPGHRGDEFIAFLGVEAALCYYHSYIAIAVTFVLLGVSGSEFEC